MQYNCQLQYLLERRLATELHIVATMPHWRDRKKEIAIDLQNREIDHLVIFCNSSHFRFRCLSDAINVFCL
jgi:hypothetical protein